MPVELEGYVRPGCTILTVFIAMPDSMWVKVTCSLDALHDIRKRVKFSFFNLLHIGQGILNNSMN